MTAAGTVLVDKHGKRYELVAPEGGWGFIVTLSISLFFSVTVVPICVFGLVFGSFLGNIGDETYGITLANGVFNAVLSFTGLAANHLLQTYSCRKVGLLGASLFFIGSFGTVFVQNLGQLILTFGVFQGFGFGLLMPAGFTAFNGYFLRRQNVMMGLAQAVVVGITMAWPIFTKALLDKYGWRGTQLVFAALSLNCFVAMISLQPVKWHLKKRYLTNIELQQVSEDNGMLTESEQPLMKKKLNTSRNFLSDLENKRPSVISIGSMAVSVSNMNVVGVEDQSKKSYLQRISKALDLELFKDPVFVNIAFGLSLSLTADLLFLSLLPMILRNSNYSPEETTLVLTIYFGSDLVCRVLLSILSAVANVRNRYLFLAGSLLSAAFRTAFVMNDAFLWVACTCGALGFLRCLIQTPLPLVVAEQYGQRFSTAFTLYMVVCAVVFCVFSPLIGLVREATESDIMVVHLLTTAYLLCGIPWSIELIFKKLTNSEAKK